MGRQAEDGCTVAIQSSAAVWNRVETKPMNGERTRIHNYECKSFSYLMSHFFCIYIVLYSLNNSDVYVRHVHVHAHTRTSPAHQHFTYVVVFSDLSVLKTTASIPRYRSVAR